MALGLAVAISLTGCAGPEASAPEPLAPTPTEAPAEGIDPQIVTALEAALDQSFAASELPGVIVGLWIPGEGEWVSSRGTADLETGEPMAAGNQQKIGSITKTITTTVALQIIGEGTYDLTLDDTIDRWYPDFPEASRITVRMLMNMSSGIGESGIAQVERICADPHAAADPERVIAIGAATPRTGFAPGEGFTYANFNTFILGRILEQTTGEDLGSLIQTRIIEPFGMTRSRFAPDGQLEAPLTHGYTLFCPDLPQPSDTVDWSNAESWAAGGMVSTLDDIHAWGRALGSGAGISPEILAARYDDTAVPLTADGLGYGLGVQVHRDPATGCILDLGHTGAEPGYGTNLNYFATTESVFAAFANGDGGTGEEIFTIVQGLYPIFQPL
ncbi:MAG TPA: serine hydrolase domain-containing protein, partial [Microbacterium sp.]|nr:serine hydrolase domain-containing protein [Microbacterium sp.]